MGRRTIDRFALCEVAVVLACEEGVPVAAHDAFYVAIADVVEHSFCHLGGISKDESAPGYGVNNSMSGKASTCKHVAACSEESSRLPTACAVASSRLRFCIHHTNMST